MTEIIDTSRKLATTIVEELEQCSALLMDGKEEQFRKNFLNLLDNSYNFIELLSAIENSRQEGVRISPLIESIRRRIQEILQVNASGNKVLLGQIMKYEMVPLFETWPSLAQAVFK